MSQTNIGFRGAESRCLIEFVKGDKKLNELQSAASACDGVCADAGRCWISHWRSGAAQVEALRRSLRGERAQRSTASFLHLIMRSASAGNTRLV